MRRLVKVLLQLPFFMVTIQAANKLQLYSRQIVKHNIPTEPDCCAAHKVSMEAAATTSPQLLKAFSQ